VKLARRWRGLPKNDNYLFLLAIQLCGAIFFICQELPEFRQIVLYPEKLPKDTNSDFCGRRGRHRMKPRPFKGLDRSSSWNNTDFVAQSL